MVALTRVWDADLNSIYQLQPNETLTQGWISLHPFGRALLADTSVVQKFVATTDNDDGTRVVHQVSSVTVTTCACGNPLATASWVVG